MTLGEEAHAPARAGLPARARGLWTAALALARGETERTRRHRNALLALAIRVASAAIAYLSQVLLARWMGSFEYGIFVFVWVWVLILGGLSPVGLSTSAIRFVAEYRETGRFDLLRGFVGSARALAVALSTGLALAGLGWLWAFGGTVADYYLLPAFLILFCLPAYSAVDIQDGISRGFAWIDVALLSPYILRPLFILAGMGAGLAAGLPLTAVTAAGAAVLACWAAALVQTVSLGRRMRAVVPPGPRAYRAGLWLKVSAPLLIVHGFELLLQNTDVLVLSRYVEPNEVAIYFAALKTIGLVSFVHFAVGTAAASGFSAHQARGDREGLEAAVREAVFWTFWPTLAGAVVLLALGRPLLWLFGPEFTGGYPVMFILAVGYLLRAAVGPAEFVLNMLGEQKACAGVLSLAAILNLALNFALIPPFGITGAAIATAASIGVSSGLMLVVARRRLGLDILVRR